MPTYLHLCEACNHEWEDVYSISASVPTTCPNCSVEGQVRRLIASANPGKVELSGNDLKQKVLADAQEYKRQFNKDENVRANFYGESSYHKAEVKEAKYLKDMNSIFKRSK